MPPSSDHHPKDFQRYVYGVLALIAVLTCLLFLLQLFKAANAFVGDLSVDEDNPVDEAQLILSQAEDAVASAELILSFLQGTSVLAGVLLIGLGYYGLDRFNKLDEEIKVLQELRGQLIPYKSQLERLNETEQKVEAAEANFNKRIEQQVLPDFTDLIQAYQEIGVKNYAEAYHYVVRILERASANHLQSDNVQALYLAGWLEVNYVSEKTLPNALDVGLAHLSKAMQLDKDSHMIRAAFGVGLRRKAQRAKGDERKRYLYESIHYLYEEALEKNPNLIDLNHESFWAPLAGSYRDLSDIDENIVHWEMLDKSITGYKRALAITPNSSYPAGNLATLYLQKSTVESNFLAESLKYFEKALTTAEKELQSNPGDYYAMMDSAMASAMLASKGNSKERLREAQGWLDDALEMHLTEKMLQISLNAGWQRLLKFTPADPAWSEVRTFLVSAIERLTEEIKQKIRQTAQLSGLPQL